MRWSYRVLTGGGLAIAASAAVIAPTHGTEPSTPAHVALASETSRQAENLALIQGRLDSGEADPPGDARAAAARGEFGLIVTGDDRSMAFPRGLTCLTPGRQAPRVLVSYRHSDTPGPRDGRWFVYAEAYNRALATSPDYPDADLCRLHVRSDDQSFWRNFPIEEAAQSVSGPVHNLHEAARRGGPADIRNWLRNTPVNAFDGFGMTALSWAVARDNRAAAEALLSTGANPWAARDAFDGDAVFWSAAFGRRAWFEQLSRMHGRPFDSWSHRHLQGAMAGGDAAIVARMLGEAHEPVREQDLGDPLPNTAVTDLVLRDNPSLAEPLLLRAVGREPRLDLVNLALAHGASPNARWPNSGDDPALVTAALGFHAASVPIVEALLRAGADPNIEGRWRRPLWSAAGTMHLDDRVSEIDGYARTIFDHLLAAGADINLPDFRGRPQIWALLFPYGSSHRQLDARFVTPQLLELLVRSGLDINARQRGERVLPLVEAQAGRTSELAVTLRRLGARH